MSATNYNKISPDPQNPQLIHSSSEDNSKSINPKPTDFFFQPLQPLYNHLSEWVLKSNR